MAIVKDAGTSGRDHYSGIYSAGLEAEAAWLRLGAVEKVNSIEQLLRERGVRPATVLELGCGTGAVILECQRRNLGVSFTAVDFSTEAIQYLAARSSGIRCLAGDITDPAFTPEHDVDLLVLSHVLEHLEQPLQFLRTLLNKVRARYLVLEVPLEDLPALRLKNLFRDRTRNPAGHVQFFTEAAFHRLIRSANLEAVGRRRYVPVNSPETVRFLGKKDKLSGLRTQAMLWTRCYLPQFLKPLWGKLYYAHCALLCVPPEQHEAR